MRIFLSGAIAVILSWLGVGCRVGDRVEKPENPDHLSGYYLTHPQSLRFFAQTTKTSVTQESDAPLFMIPTEVSQFLSNPVALILEDLATGRASLARPKGSQALPTNVGPGNILTFKGVTPKLTHWHDSACQSYLALTEDGAILKETKLTPPSGNPYPISGEIQLAIRVTTVFEGDCGPTFQALSDCYHDFTLCQGVNTSDNLRTQSAVTDTFSPWIRSEAMTAAEIAHLTGYGYTVTYRGDP